MRVLAWVIGGAAVLATGGWFAAAYGIEQVATRVLADMSARGMTAQTSDLSVGGFPARLDLRLTDLTLADPVGGMGWQAPGLRVFAQSWAPWALTAEFAPVQVVSTPDMVVTLQSDALQATLTSAADADLPLRKAALAGTALTAVSDLGWTLGLGEFSVALVADDSRPDGAYLLDFDLAPLTPDPAFLASLRAVTLPGLPAPDFPDAVDALWGRIGLRYSAPLDRHAGETRPQLDVIEVQSATFAWGPLALSASGQLEADPQGYAQGRVTLELTNWDRLPALLVAMGAVKPEIAPTVGNMLGALAAQSPDPAVLSLALDMEGGRMSLGPFPLGEAPRLRGPSS